VSVGRIFSIEEFATFDGPGVRMTVFLKGCPLSCTWCHNPEGQCFDTEYVRVNGQCRRCGKCEREAVRDLSGGLRFTEASAEACPEGLVKKCGEEYTPEELIKVLEKNVRLLEKLGGGITFSGGEPLSSHKFLFESLDLLEGKAHRAIQTSGYAPKEIFTEALSRCDYVLFDIKIMDEDMHKRFCGRSNRQILVKYKILVSSGVPFVTRVPLIPGVTDTEENLSRIAEFMKSLGVDYVELLPYNKAAGAKYGGVLREYSPGFDEKREVRLDKSPFERLSITAKIM
jgi:pyruvate formate lyase activating enzyme